MGVCVGKLGANATGPRLLSLSCLLEAPGRDFFPAHCDTMFAPNTSCLAWQVSKAVKSELAWGCPVTVCS